MKVLSCQGHRSYRNHFNKAGLQKPKWGRKTTTLGYFSILHVNWSGNRKYRRIILSITV